MNRLIGPMRFQLVATAVAAFALVCGSAAGQVTQTAPPPNRNLTLPAPHKQGPGAGGQHALPGRIEGFVYWDAQTVAHNPPGSCTGFSVAVTSSDMPVGNAAAQFGAKPAGQVKAFLAGGKVVVYDVCTYSYSNVPEGPQLQVRLSITPTAAFSPPVEPVNPAVSSVAVINAPCNMLPNIVTATLADLQAHWGSCQDVAYDVNFLLAPASGMASGAGTVARPLLQGASAAPLLKNTSPNGSGPLSVQSAGLQSSFLIGAAAPGNVPATRLQPYTGVVRGVVTWRQDGKPGYLAHNPPESCAGLSISVSAGPTKIATLSSLQYLGVVPYPSHLDPVCSYSISAPVGQDLTVAIGIAPAAFTPPAKVLVAPAPQPIRIPGGQCTQSWSPIPANGLEPAAGPADGLAEIMPTTRASFWRPWSEDCANFRRECEVFRTSE
jgi:hypothetical protein